MHAHTLTHILDPLSDRGLSKLWPQTCLCPWCWSSRHVCKCAVFSQYHTSLFFILDLRYSFSRIHPHCEKLPNIWLTRLYISLFFVLSSSYVPSYQVRASPSFSPSRWTAALVSSCWATGRCWSNTCWRTTAASTCVRSATTWELMSASPCTSPSKVRADGQ